MTSDDPRDVFVCREEELPPGEMKLVPIGKFGVGVFNAHGTLYALTNYCPHQGGPLCLGRVQGTTAFDPDSASRSTYVSEGTVIRCPWHQWEFDMTTGKTIAEPTRKIRMYDVRVEDGRIILRR